MKQNMNIKLNLSSLEKTKKEIEFYRQNGTCSATSLLGDLNIESRGAATDRNHYNTAKP